MSGRVREKRERDDTRFVVFDVSSVTLDSILHEIGSEGKKGRHEIILVQASKFTNPNRIGNVIDWGFKSWMGTKSEQVGEILHVSLTVKQLKAFRYIVEHFDTL